MIPNLSDEARRSSGGSEKSGLLERVIEDWLTKANERQYHLPFCQVLSAEGETILFVSTHGQFEKGKDVITRTPAGEIRAYQLKAGDLGVPDWRKIYGEIVDLVELPIELPGTPPITDFTPILVTNGELNQPCLEQVRSSNAAWKARGIGKELQAVQKGELFRRFAESHGAFLPHELEDFRTFLELILRSGTEPADKEKSAQLFEHLIPDANQLKKTLTVQRVATSIALLTAYISGAANSASNHWAVFEYWVLAGAYVLQVLERSAAPDDACETTFRICEMAADNALEALARESQERTHLVEGFPLFDGQTYHPRITILLGLLCAWDLSLQMRRLPRPFRDFVASFVAEHRGEMQAWGESAVPFMFAVILAVEQNGKPLIAEAVAMQLIREVSVANGSAALGRGVSNPYYSAEESLRLDLGFEPLNDEQFVGFSYSVGPLVEFLARRWRRQGLASLWYGITRLSMMEYFPQNGAEWYRWNSSDGVLRSQLAGEPESWRLLLERASSSRVEGLPESLVKRPWFALWFVIVFPHRFTRAASKLIDEGVWDRSVTRG